MKNIVELIKLFIALLLGKKSLVTAIAPGQRILANGSNDKPASGSVRVDASFPVMRLSQAPDGPMSSLIGLWIFDTSKGPITATLEAPATADGGGPITIKCYGIHPLTVVSQADTIDGNAALSLRNKDWLTVQSHGPAPSMWVVIGSSRLHL
jgi:hypothetical protein